jgi:alpha-1,3/alpha-1,6-mannosyltransferase
MLAYIRTLICALWLICYDGGYKAIVCDQVSIVLPFLRITGQNTIFYCHFPDKLLSGSKKNILKRIYRFFIDLAEELSLLFAKKIYVNSEYTKEIFFMHYKLITKIKKIDVEILYPAIDFKQFEEEVKS